MKEKMICLAGDNWTPAHPDILQAICEANEGSAEPYGADQWTKKAEKVLQSAFGTKCKVFFVPTGTGANVFSLRLAVARYESILCSDISHIHYQESGAAEALIGCKLLTVPHQKGKIDCDAIRDRLEHERAFGKHSTIPKVLSVAQPTEVGTIYSLSELASLAELCQKENLFFHIDGCRIYHAAASLETSLEDIMAAAQPDVVSVGGTKNGCVAAEASLVMNPSLYRGSDHLQKQTLQLVSKMRYVSAQYIPFFEKKLWKSCARQANKSAKALEDLIQATPQLHLSYPVETNQIFFTAPESWIPLIQEKIFCYVWSRKKKELRWITSWNTSVQDSETVRLILKEISKSKESCLLNKPL